MTVTTETAASDVPTVSRGPRRGRIRVIIAASLLTGLVLAAVLPLVVFGSGSEAVISGSALLGFAAGWAMLALLSTRR